MEKINTIKKALKPCKQSGNNPDDPFVGADKMVQIGSQTTREVEDYHLWRLAYLPDRPKRRPQKN